MKTWRKAQFPRESPVSARAIFWKVALFNNQYLQLLMLGFWAHVRGGWIPPLWVFI